MVGGPGIVGKAMDVGVFVTTARTTYSITLSGTCTTDTCLRKLII